MHTVHGLPHPPASAGVVPPYGYVRGVDVLSACAPPSNQAEEELRKEIQALKTQVAAAEESSTRCSSASKPFWTC